MPFKASSIENLHKMIIKGNFDFPEECELSVEVKDLIKNMITVDPKQRFDISRVLNHSWLILLN